jgi:hypothetical protein
MTYFKSDFLTKKKIAILTGDVHHRLIGIHDGPFSSWSKMDFDCMKEEIEIINKENIKATFFVTGKLLKQKKDFLYFKEFKNIEFGGHTYFAFQPDFLRLFFKYFLHSEYGPRFWQRYDINKIHSEFKEQGMTMTSWRTHSYKSDINTLDLLTKKGIRIISDKHSIGEPKIVINSQKMIELFITMPKDEVIEPNLKKENEKWMENYKDLLNKSLSKHEMIVLAIHPTRMKILDNFKFFKEIIHLLKKNKYEFIKVSELLKYEP